MERNDGYAPIRDYAAIGDGRTVALVAKDGAIDWLCLPDVDSGAVFSRLVDAPGGGCFELRPAGRFESERTYEEDSNVLETTFRTSSGSVRVTDALVLADDTLVPMRELVRKVEALEGSVRMLWRIEPTFDFGRMRATIERRGRHPVALAGRDAFAVCAWHAGEPQTSETAIEGEFVAEPGRTALIDLAATHQEPLVLPVRAEVERRLERTRRFWPQWVARMQYDGPWRDAVARSALALKLCVFSPSGAIIAAPTTSLPEWIGADANFDYRFAWLRDASFTLDALLGLGYRDEAQAFFWWFMHAARRTLPRLQILHRVNGAIEAHERELDGLDGYCGSKPVRVGNAAATQMQLDVYGDVLDSAWRYSSAGNEIDRDTGRDLAKIADHVCEIWREPDSGIWEVRGRRADFTHSNAMSWVALDRACSLAENGVVPDRRERWLREADAIREFVDGECWDDELQSYIRAPDLRELDASLFTLATFRYGGADDERVAKTVDAVRRGLGEGPLVFRNRDSREGAFLACSFWLVDALANLGRLDEAEQLMDEVCSLANDVGLFAEEIRAEDGAFLGNFPQGLVHLALVNAALTIEEHR
jgi:GH15 family glucan-1,4-alpha-glucosidase